MPTRIPNTGPGEPDGTGGPGSTGGTGGPEGPRGPRTASVTLVTGAGSGIGAAVALHLAERGHSLALLDRNAETLELTHKAVRERASHARTRTYVTDVTSSHQVQTAVETVEARQGPIGGLVNAAGVLRLGSVTEFTDDDWAQTFAVNATGVFYVSRAVARHMAARHHGAIVTVASNAARVPRAHMGAYAASKAASQSLTHTLGLELGPLGIRCNVVAPGSTDTPMLRSMWTDESDRLATMAGDPDRFRVGIPLGKLATAEDIAHSVAFLLSDEAGHVTLSTLAVDGGAALGAS